MEQKKSPSKLKRKYRTIQYSCFIGEFVAAATPFVTIAIVNKDKYFVDFDGTRMSVALFMALAVMGFAIWGVAKQNVKNSYIAFLVKWAIGAFVVTMIGQMVTDLATIMWFGLIGLCTAFGLDLGSKKAQKLKNKVTEAQEQADKEDMVEAVKEEKKIKVKVIKK